MMPAIVKDGLVINHFLELHKTIVIVITCETGYRFVDDTDEDFIDTNGLFCEMCDKPLVGRKQKRFCSIKCVCHSHNAKRFY